VARDKLTELVIGIRPEHLHQAENAGSGPGSGAGRPGAASAPTAGVVLTGEVLLVEELGADALLHVRLAGDAPVAGSGGVVARTEGRKSPAPGQRVSFRVQPDDVFAFHPVTGARLAG
jgi:ABC-type sugar transport system ATPase subunit